MEVTGIDICKPLTSADVAAIEQGMDDYAILTFPDQPLTDEGSRSRSPPTSANWKSPSQAGMAKPEERRFQQLELGDNLSTSMAPTLTKAASARRQAADAALAEPAVQHSDASFTRDWRQLCRYCMRVSFAFPKKADTQFAGIRAAYDALSAA